MPKLLIIDDEPSIRLSIKAVFNREDISVFGAETAEEGIRFAAEHSPDVILLDIRLGKCSGLELFHELRRIDPRCIIIFITGHGTTETAIEAMKLGAFDYLTKPLDAKQLKQVVEQAFAISRLVHVPAIIDEGERPEDKPDRLIGSGQAMQTVCKQIGRVAPQNVNVLILGESGTGKELVARALYHHSHRSQAPFLAINCAAIPESLLESELFGYERGAFTGADRRRIGKFEQCHGGTIFLDEVGDMALHTQAKILRLLQEGCFERLGGNESISVDVRIIAATNQNIESLIERAAIPQGSLLSIVRRDDRLATAAGSFRRHCRTGALLSLPLQPPARHVSAIDLARGFGVDAILLVAGKRARTAKRHSPSPYRLCGAYALAGISPRRIAATVFRNRRSYRRVIRFPIPIGKFCRKPSKTGSPAARPRFIPACENNSIN